MRTYYYSAFLLVGGAIYLFLSPNVASSDNAGKPAQANGEATSSADDSVEGTEKTDEPNRYPKNLCKQFIEVRLCDLDNDAQHWQLRNDIKEPRFIVASVPDPLATHLRVEFDRAIDGIKDAAADEHYLLQRYWLPWSLEVPRFSDLASLKKEDESLANDRKQPGFLLFENSQHRSLIVFLVGESPIDGIHRQQFQSAIHLKSKIEDLSKEAHTRLYFLGTSFSGSLYSLQLALEKNKPTDFEAVSGTAQDEESIAEFNDHFKEGDGTPHFRTLLHGSNAALKRFLDYIERSWHYSGKTAILSETDTVFGALREIISDDRRVFSIPFPRDISHLRNAYQSYPDLRGLSPRSPDSEQSKNLPLQLGDQVNTIDSIPDFAAQTVVSQETMALQIVNRIRHEGIRFAGIVGSNSLDLLFVSRFLRAASPDTRLFVLNPDLLFVHAADTLPFEGILAVSTYPLLEGNPPLAIGTAVPGESHWIFAAPLQQGIHNAARVLLGDISADPTHPAGASHRPLAGYYVAAEDDSEPVLWITSVGRESFVPIAALSSPKGQKPMKAASMPMAAVKLLSGEVHDPTRLWWIVLIGFTLAMAGIARLFFEAQRAHASWVADYSFAGPASRRTNLRLLLIFVVGIYLLFMSTGTPLLLCSAGHPEATLTFAGSAIAGIVAMRYLFLPLSKWRGARSSGGLATGFAVAGVLLTLFLFLNLSLRGENFSHFFFAFRSYELSAGTAPTVPFFFLLSGFIVWSFVGLHRDIFHCGRRPLLPRAKGDTILGENIRSAARQLARHLHDPFRKSWNTTSIVTLAAFILSLLALRESGLRSFEGALYDWIFMTWASALSAALIVTALHFLKSWLLLERVLDQLEMHPLRRGLKALPPDQSWSPIWQSSPRERSYLILTRSLNALAAFRYSEVTAPEIANVTKRVDAILRRAAMGERRTDAEHVRAQVALREAADDLIDKLRPQWQAGGSEILERRASDSAKDDGDLAGQRLDEAPPLVYALEFVSMRYLAFIRYVMLQLRNTLTFLTLGFLAFAFALMSYPFQGERLIAWIITGLFVVLSSAVVFVFAQMESDPVLGRITNRDGVKSGAAFAHRLLAFGALPLLTVLASNFNGVGRLLFSWIQPALRTLH
jgi:hypothetical protein